MSEKAKTKVFWSGNSQAVRLPSDFRLDVDEVWIRREGRSLVLEPIEPGWSRGFIEAFGALPDLERPPQQGPQEREELFP